MMGISRGVVGARERKGIIGSWQATCFRVFVFRFQVDFVGSWGLGIEVAGKDRESKIGVYPFVCGSRGWVQGGNLVGVVYRVVVAQTSG